jgi:hypothetical protein
MSLEAGNTIKQLVATNPEGTDPKSQGDDHLRLLKATLKNQFSGFTDGIPITRTESQINSMLLRGAYGLGSTAIPFSDPNVAAGSFESGFYFWQGGGGNTPPGAAAGDTMLQIVTNSDLITQEWTRVTDAAQYVRKFQTPGWGPWVPQVSGFRQANFLDLTPAALMAVGAFGLGGKGESFAPINIDTVLPCTYFVGIQTGVTGTGPPGGVPGDMMLSLCYSASLVFQVWYAMNGNTWTRRFTGGWSVWLPLTGVGVGQAWQDLTASRAAATTYQNQTGRPIQISIGGQTAGASGAVQISTGGGVVIAKQTWAGSNGNLPWHLGAIIPAAGLYQFDGGGGIANWAELR